MRRDVALEDVLRRALGRAGIVLRYEHVCRAVAGTKGDPFAAPVLQDSPEAQKGVLDGGRQRQAGESSAGISSAP